MMEIGSQVAPMAKILWKEIRKSRSVMDKENSKKFIRGTLAGLLETTR
jgi:hypothetical protein